MYGKIVDMHAHMVTPAYVAGLEKANINVAKEDGFPLPKWDVESHLQFMADAGIEYSVLSLSTPHIYFGDAQEARQLARAINEETAAICRQYPEQFGFAACLPMPDVEGSIQEVIYAMDTLNAVGVKVASNSFGVYLGDARFDPIFAELDKRHATVIIHPSKAQDVPQNVFTAGPAPLFEFITDTTRAVLNLIARGTIAKYPNVNIVVPHCGSFLPFVAQRLVGIAEVLVPKGMMEPVDVKESINRLYFDIAGDALPVALDCLLKIADPKKIVYGGDFPHTPGAITVRKNQALLEYPALADIREDVFCNNANRLLGRKQG